MQDLQQELDAQGIALQLTTGADVHVVPDFVAGLRSGHLLSLADSRYVLVEPPHHVAPPRLDDLFFQLIVAGYVPILTHPERLGWIKSHYAAIQDLARAGDMDADHRRLADRGVRQDSPILGRADAGRGAGAHSCNRCSRYPAPSA